MANEKNLMPIEEVNSRRTREEHSEDSRKAGVASGVSRRRKRSLKEAADLFLSLPVKDGRTLNSLRRKGIDEEDADNQMAIIVGLASVARLGDARAAKLLFDLLGEDGDGHTDIAREDGLSRSLKDLAEELESDDQS